MNSSEIRSRFLKFFEKRGHAIIPSASLVTPDEKGVTNATLFNTAGMQPLVPYLLGKAHPLGTRLVDAQKCLRTVDIDDIGDKTHATFFEMLGNWSLGDYFKKEAINWSYEFLTSKEEGLGLDPNRLYVTVFEGDTNAPRDDEAATIWKEVFTKNGVDFGGEELGLPSTKTRIFYLPADKNWWEAGDNGPCGPDTEMFYDISNTFGGKTLSREEFLRADDARQVVEVWNDVFMQYEKKDGKIVGTLPKPSVDTGAGLERLTMTLQGVDNIYDTDLLKPVMDTIEEFRILKNDSAGSFSTTEEDLKAKRIIADHIRAAIFLIEDGVIPSNKDRGYVLRKIIRRAVSKMNRNFLNHDSSWVSQLVRVITTIYASQYPGVKSSSDSIEKELVLEIDHFYKILLTGENRIIKIMEKLDKNNPIIPTHEIFQLVTAEGIPIELIKDIAASKGFGININKFEEEMQKHQSLSRAGAEQKFKGGLADANDPMVLRYHTATHILHQALHDVLGDEVTQKGSNITSERLRFDFAHSAKMTDEEKKRVEDIVNEKIAQKLPMQNVVMPKTEAEKTGARHFFGEKYGDEVSVYFVGNDLASAYSKEFCGGPHVKNTSELAGEAGKWTFKIQKEEAVSAGVRRIKAVLQ